MNMKAYFAHNCTLKVNDCYRNDPHTVIHEEIPYNYYKAMYNDIAAWMMENTYTVCEIVRKNGLDEDSIFQEIYDLLWIEDSVTGNGSGSYTFSRYEADLALMGNRELLIDALEEFGCELPEYKKSLLDPEYADVTIRCYMLNQALDEVIQNTQIICYNPATSDVEIQFTGVNVK